MNTVLENMTGMNAMTDQVIATDLLIAAKSGINNTAMALTQATSPEVRNMLCDQLSKAVTLHEQIFNYMHQKGLYETKDINKQLQTDLKAADTALNQQNQ